MAKLTPKQKEVIQKMRDNYVLDSRAGYTSAILSKDHNNEERVSFYSIHTLIKKGLISFKAAMTGMYTYYYLTELGKTIEL